MFEIISYLFNLRATLLLLLGCLLFNAACANDDLEDKPQARHSGRDGGRGHHGGASGEGNSNASSLGLPSPTPAGW